MGVPVITLYGSCSRGRLSASILQAIVRPEWIARSENEFVAIACRLAEDRTDLASIRSTLRQEMQLSKLCDGSAFCRRLEREYRRIWKRWYYTEASGPTNVV
jgi:protein O-GlcNAc transferase